MTDFVTLEESASDQLWNFNEDKLVDLDYTAWDFFFLNENVGVRKTNFEFFFLVCASRFWSLPIQIIFTKNIACFVIYVASML